MYLYLYLVLIDGAATWGIVFYPARLHPKPEVEFYIVMYHTMCCFIPQQWFSESGLAFS